MRAGMLMQTVFVDSKDESWAELREVVKNNPLVDKTGQLLHRGFARCVAPPIRDNLYARLVDC